MMNESTARMEAITDNLANSATPGYRKAVCVQQSFDQILNEKTRPLSCLLDFSQGAIRNTGNATDFALNGNGFFVLEKDGNELYTRNGQFSIGPEGVLISSNGMNVKSSSGNIIIPQNVDPRKLTVNADGTLMADGQSVAQLSIVDFEDPKVLRKVSPTLLQAPEGAKAEPVKDPAVLNMSLEASNSSVFEEMAELIQCSRSFEQAQKSLRQQDDLESKTIVALSQ